MLPKNYFRPELDKRILGEIIDLFSNIDVGGNGAREKDVLGRVYLVLFVNGMPLVVMELKVHPEKK